MTAPEQAAREQIDLMLDAAGWKVQDRGNIKLHADLGVADRGFPIESRAADYALFVEQKAVGIMEAKPAVTTLSGVAEQSAQCWRNVPPAFLI